MPLSSPWWWLVARTAPPRRAAKKALARLRTRLAGPAPGREPVVCYGRPSMPSLQDKVVLGGLVKFQRLHERFPNSTLRFNILYLGSSCLHEDWRAWLREARHKGARVVWNQNGVAFPAWCPDPEPINAPLREGIRQADLVIYQSAFCQESSERFLGAPACPSVVLHNAVDTEVFTPPDAPPAGPCRLLAGGNQYDRAKHLSTLETFALVRRGIPDARLVVSGRLQWLPSEDDCRRESLALAARLGVADGVDYHGSYSQAEAPAFYRGMHLLLHTKYNDPCPNAVIEAMACGLPVVYSASGGVPELVGDEAGAGIPVPASWDTYHTADPAAMADAALRVLQNRPAFSAAARARVVRLFSFDAWARRHEELFNRLLLA